MKGNKRKDKNQDKLLQQSHLSRPSCQPGMLWRTSALLLRKQLRVSSPVWCCRSQELEAVLGMEAVSIRREGEGKKGGIFDYACQNKATKEMKGGTLPAQCKPYQIETSLETKKKASSPGQWMGWGYTNGGWEMAQVSLKSVSRWGQSLDSTNSVMLLKPAIYFVPALPSYKCSNLPSGQLSKTPDLLIYNEMLELSENEVCICQKSWQWLSAIGGEEGRLKPLPGLCNWSKSKMIRKGPSENNILPVP